MNIKNINKYNHNRNIILDYTNEINNKIKKIKNKTLKEEYNEDKLNEISKIMCEIYQKLILI